ncbi:MAG: hypothetical protein ABEJ22_05550 [Haloferacaceae archaeon]
MASSRNRRGRAKIALGLSLVFAVAIFAYLTLTRTVFLGAVVGLLVVGAGFWEYRRTMQDIVSAERFEAEAEKNQDRQRR